MSDRDQAAQNDPEWIVWSQPEQIAAKIDKLFSETLPSVPKTWERPSGDFVGPMPEGVDRYSNEMTSWITHVFDFFFPDEDALYEAESAEIVEQFICYIGEYFVRYCDGRWINEPSMCIRYSFGPVIGFSWVGDLECPEDLLFLAVDGDDFARVTVEWYSRTVDHAAAFGLPHKHLELRKKLGLA